MAGSTTGASLDPPEGEETPWLLSMRKALEGVLDDVTNTDMSTAMRFHNVWRRINSALDDNMVRGIHAELEVERDTPTHEELDVERDDTSTNSQDKMGHDKKNSLAANSASSDESAPPSLKKLRRPPFEHDDDTDTKAANSKEKQVLRSPQRCPPPTARRSDPHSKEQQVLRTATVATVLRPASYVPATVAMVLPPTSRRPSPPSAAAAARSDALGPSSADWREEDIFSLVAFLGSFVHGETHIARVDTLHTIHVVCTVKWSCRVR